MIVLAAILLLQVAEADVYTVERYTPPDDVVLEVGGMGFLSDGRLLVSTRRGQVWLVEDALADDPADATFRLFAEGLDEGLGLSVVDDRIYVLQRGELTELVDDDGDGRAETLLTVCDDWGLSGNYHEFAFGLPTGADGRFYAGLNVAFFSPKWWHGKSPVPYRGWAIALDRDGGMTPIAGGFRSPCGLGTNAAGDVFVTDNQGDWMPACPIYHLVEGRFYGHPASLDWTDDYLDHGATASDTLPPDVERAPAAVWLPYKWSRSAGNLVTDDTGGAFGPFEDQLFVGELTNGLVLRAQLEKVRGEYQGAVFMFREGVGSVCRVHFAPDGTLLAGLTNRGWGGRPPSHGLARIRWTGVMPMEMRDVHLLQDGFEIGFTKPLAAGRDPTPADVTLSQYDYDWWWEYGSPERHTTEVEVTRVEVADDRRSLVVRSAGLEPAMMARLALSGIVADDGTPLLHDEFAYTINQLPEGPLTDLHVAKLVEPPPPRETNEEGWLRLTYGDAFDAWESEGWQLVDAEVDPDDPTRFVVTEGDGALINVGAGTPGNYVGRYAFGDAKVHVDVMLPESGAAAIWAMGRYGIAIGATGLGTILDAEPRPPAFDAFKGVGQWHGLDFTFQAPRFDAEGRKVEPARLLRVMIDDVLLHENVELDGPGPGAPRDGEVARDGLVIDGRLGAVALRSIRIHPLDEPDDGAGWVRIFNGEDLEGWTLSPDAPADGWTVEDGVLIGQGERSHIFSPRGDYTDLELRATVRINDGGNSGMYFRVAHGPGWPAGYEAQVNSNFEDPVRTGSLYGLSNVSVELVPPGTWFEQHVTCRDTDAGTHVTIAVNGVVVTDFVDAERRHASGHVAFQQHHDGSVVEVRDIEVRDRR